ncbi:hypothetical protein [Reyranella sp.]|nr:hypothetical protein [Reyranella sp.]
MARRSRERRRAKWLSRLDLFAFWTVFIGSIAAAVLFAQFG